MAINLLAFLVSSEITVLDICEFEIVFVKLIQLN